MSSDLRWRESTHGDGRGGDCAAVRAGDGPWRTSVRSSDQGGDCVEVAGLGCACEERARLVAVRDSKDPEGPVLVFAPAAWRGLSGRIKSGALDLR
ncbi:DUF397 domain-containing protein [Actinomadura xylanilytica]|uniref:DUF397 domain-containing protein n=1 Tax=Actinomadura xylanilytica TaxID=887459 RepID=UPI00255B3A9F|nr:DUF397 domain-containing protein [Actinomadura xylanilytica]MDL4770642.1 DUF397 domain-containing protein [Actinomadura xylanilytica]